MDLDEERRRFQRLLVSLPVEYSTFHPESGEFLHGQGILKDFSLSGVFFHAFEPIPLQPGHTLTLTIITPLAPLSRHDSPHIRARAEVVRLEDPSPDNNYLGVGACFLEFPCFFNGAANQVNSNN